MQFPILICFSNQKGGVGKTTLSVCLANYLHSLGKSVCLMDCDPQQSITKCRTQDIESHGEDNMPYPIQGHRVLDREKMKKLISSLYSSPPANYIIFDCPGSVTDEWIIPLLGNADMVVTPFHFDKITIPSTAEFILFLEKIKEFTKRDIPLVMIPNLNVKTMGTKSEKEKWETKKEKFAEHGVVTPPISFLADMQRFSTVTDLDRQMELTAPAFEVVCRYFQ